VSSLRGALGGVRVLDLSRLLPGPYASLVLADLGAQVDKVEDPNGGDYLRHMPPLQEGRGGMFNAINRNKRSITLALKHPAGRDALLAMLPRYDVLLEQFRPGVLERLGLGHATLRATNPRLVLCALTGYGQEGPMAHRAGHDVDYLARAGILGMTGPAGGAPQLPGVQLADFAGGMWCVIGILAALAKRAVTGEGATLDVSMTECAMQFGLAAFGAVLAGGSHARAEEPLTGGLAIYGTYATKDDRAVALGALEPKFAMAFLAAVGLPVDAGAVVPGPHQAELRAKVAEAFRTRTRDEWEAFAGAHDVCLEPVLTPEEALARAGRMVFELPTSYGVLRQLRTPLTPDDVEHSAPPEQGQHTDDILREAGFDAAAVERLRASGALR